MLPAGRKGWGYFNTSSSDVIYSFTCHFIGLTFYKTIVWKLYKPHNRGFCAVQQYKACDTVRAV